MGKREDCKFLLLLLGCLFLLLQVEAQRSCIQLGHKDYYTPAGTPLCNCRESNCYHIFPRCSLCKKYNEMDKDFCNQLLDDKPEGWTRPFTGSMEDGTLINPPFYSFVCNHQPTYGTVYIISPAQDGLPRLTDYTNRFQFDEKVIAQEGISFCIIGSHYRQSPISVWEPLRGFLPMAERSFDIGNHIDPEDATRMNTVKPAPSDELRNLPNFPGSRPWNDETKIPTWRYENVLLGIVNNKRARLDRGYQKRPAYPEWQPNPRCRNPYRVKATLIEADDKILHNYLHITVYTVPMSQPAENCPTGRIKYLMLEVRDQDGFPVGQFTDDVTCDMDEKTRTNPLQCPTPTCKAHYGTKSNHVPCMFSHPKSVVHPSIFMYSATSGKVSSSGAGGGSGGASADGKTPDACRSSAPPGKRNPEKVKYKVNPENYATEVHTTWRFAQMDTGWVSELHFATMIIEDETPIQYYTSRLVHWDLVNASRLCCREELFEKYNCISGRPEHMDKCWGFESMDSPRSKNRLQIGLLNSCINSTHNTNRPYGYSAQYRPLKPTFKTRGGWDYFRKSYFNPEYVNCHLEISYGEQFYYNYMDDGKPDKLGTLPLRPTLKALLNEKYTLAQTKKYKPPKHAYRYLLLPRDPWGSWKPEGTNVEDGHMYELPDWHSPGVTLHTNESIPAKQGTGGLADDNVRYRVKTHYYYGKTPESAILKMFDSAHQDPTVLKTEFDDQPIREYFGSRHILSSGHEGISSDVQKLQGKHEEFDHGLDHTFTMEAMGDDEKSRCPCPFVPTMPPPQLATRSPLEVEGRKKHVVNMLIAWVVLVPLSYFIARFYKETYSRLFFLQEFWWFTIHVLSLITALLFTFGGLYALKVKRAQEGEYEIFWSDATVAHVFMGYTTIGLFIIHLLLGAFRFVDPEYRIIQIALHWLFGWLEYMCAAGCIFAAAAIPFGVMSCETFGIYSAFIAYQVVFTLGMEYHLRVVDDKLRLDPPRAYFPSPMMRLFHRDAPFSRFRVIMLAVYVLGCFLFYVAMHISINMEGAERSCFQPVAEDE